MPICNILQGDEIVACGSMPGLPALTDDGDGDHAATHYKWLLTIKTKVDCAEVSYHTWPVHAATGERFDPVEMTNQGRIEAGTAVASSTPSKLPA